MPDHTEATENPPQPTEPGPPDHFCNAETRDGTPCRNRAGYKTDHPGEGRCHLHGGSTPVKHGLYSKLDRYELGDRIQELRENPQLTNLRDQIAVQTAMVERYLKEIADQETVDADTLKAVNRAVDLLSRNVHRMRKIEDGKALNPQEVDVFLTQIVQVVRDEAGEETAQRVGKRLLEVEETGQLEP